MGVTVSECPSAARLVSIHLSAVGYGVMGGYGAVPACILAKIGYKSVATTEMYFWRQSCDSVSEISRPLIYGHYFRGCLS